MTRLMRMSTIGWDYQKEEVESQGCQRRASTLRSKSQKAGMMKNSIDWDCLQVGAESLSTVTTLNWTTTVTLLVSIKIVLARITIWISLKIMTRLRKRIGPIFPSHRAIMNSHRFNHYQRAWRRSIRRRRDSILQRLLSHTHTWTMKRMMSMSLLLIS